MVLDIENQKTDQKMSNEYVINVYDKNTYDCVTSLMALDKKKKDNTLSDSETIGGLHDLIETLRKHKNRLNKIKLFIKSHEDLDQTEEAIISMLIKSISNNNIVLYCRNDLLNISSNHDILKIRFDNSVQSIVYEDGSNEMIDIYDLSIPKLKRETFDDYV